MLDNFEHLLDAGTQVVKLVQASPWLKVLVTSREALHLRGETRYPLPPLQLPALTDSVSLGELARNPAVQLFAERARSVDSSFALTEENALEVAKVCVNLSGLPLAIELAAGRVAMFPPRILLSRLGQQLKVLTGGSRDLPPRQRTLRGAIEWSYKLLDAGHRELFSRLAVFWGGCTLQGLEAVCNSAGLAIEGKGLKRLQVEVRDGLETLLSSNLLQQREGRDGEPRFWMLETIHEYAREKLEERGEAQTLQREHALYFMRLAEEVEPHLTGKEQQEWLQRLDDEYDNVRAALAWCVEDGQRGHEGAEIGLRTAGVIWRFWLMRGLYTEGRKQLERALSMPEGVLQACSPGSRAKALHGAGGLAYRQGDYSSASSLLEKALVLGREAGDKQNISRALNVLGSVAWEQGDYTRARALHKESLALRRELGDKSGITISLNNLGIVAYQQGDYAGARALYEESLAMRREIGDKRGMAVTLVGLGSLAVGVGQVKDTEKGTKLLGAVQGLLKNMGAVLQRDDRLPYEKAVASARSALGDEAFEKAWQEGRRMSLEEAVGHALEGTGKDQ